MVMTEYSHMYFILAARGRDFRDITTVTATEHLKQSLGQVSSISPHQ